MAATSRYWVVSLPVQDSASILWTRLQDSISRNAFDTLLYRFNVPDLRVGTLDSLLALSDDLLKSNNFVEGVSHKIRRQIEELEKAGGVESGTLTVDGVPIDSYITRFTWDEAKYPTMSPLREIVDGIHAQIARIEDDLKVRVAEYNNVRGQLNAINRKQSGSLAVRDLSDLVKPDDIIASENLVTLIAVVPKYSQKDWLCSYETLTNFVVRDFEYCPETQQSRIQELEQLVQDQASMRNSLLQWCYTSYGEVFSSWMHFCAVRIFTESILRYGLPPSFLSAVIAPSAKNEKKVRSILENLCGSSVNNTFWKAEDDVSLAGVGADADAHPYVSFTINFM